MKTLIKTDEHNKHVSESVKRAWKEGKFDTEEYLKASKEGYKKRRSFAGKNNPMYGKKSPIGSGRGKGGIREDIGFYVRSSWEANLCRIFKLYNRDFIFEPKRFEIIINNIPCTYLPDFYIKKSNKYYEIKGHAKSSNNWFCSCSVCIKNREKIRQVREKYGIKITVIGNFEYKKLKKKFKKSIPTWEKDN